MQRTPAGGGGRQGAGAGCPANGPSGVIGATMPEEVNSKKPEGLSGYGPSRVIGATATPSERSYA